MGKLILYFFTLVSLSSCLSRRFAINPFIEKGYCFQDTLSSLRTQIMLDGYYEYSHIYTGTRTVWDKKWSEFHSEKYKDTEVKKNVFYDNGLAMLNFRLNDLQSASLVRYVLKNDTIKTILTRTGGQTPGLEYEFLKIINDSTLEYLGFTYDEEIDSVRIQKFKNGNADDPKSMGTYSKVRFISSKELPDYRDQWVLKQKWFWCDEEKYNKFMQQLNNTK